MKNYLATNADTDAPRALIDGNPFFCLDDDVAGIVEPGKFTGFVMVADHPVSNLEAEHIVQLAGYYWQTIVKGTQPLAGWKHTGNTIIFNQGIYSVDTHDFVSNSDDPQSRFLDFIINFNELLRAGSKPRKDGSQLVPPMKKAPKITFWVNEVEQMKKNAKVVANVTSNLLSKTAGELTLNDVSALLEDSRNANARLLEAEAEIARLRGIVSAIQGLVN